MSIRYCHLEILLIFSTNLKKSLEREDFEFFIAGSILFQI